MAAAITRWAGSIHVLRSTAGGNLINCFKLVPCKTGTFLENGLAAPMFTGVQEAHCSLQPPRQLQLHAGVQCSNNSIRSIAVSTSAYSTARHTCGKVTMGELTAAISSNWHHGGGYQSDDGRWCSETRCCRLHDNVCQGAWGEGIVRARLIACGQFVTACDWTLWSATIVSTRHCTGGIRRVHAASQKRALHPANANGEHVHQPKHVEAKR